jgi:aminoglycoside phosphotransferase (APT) family kinase protein
MADVGIGLAPDLIGGVDLARVQRWMDDEGLGHGEIVDVELVSGGTQNILIRFRRGESSFMLRRPPRHKRPESDRLIEREAGVLAALKDTAVPHPEMVGLCSDHEVLGASFYLMSVVPGFNPTTSLPGAFSTHPPTQHYMGLAMVDGLIALSQVDISAPGLAELTRREDWVTGQVARWDRRLAGYQAVPGYDSGALGDVETLRGWLTDNTPGSWTPGLVHGDYHFANVLFAPHRPELAAVVDWELASIGDPLLDLGHLLATWPFHGAGSITNLPTAPGLPSRAEIIARYGWLTGRNLDHLVWYRVLACYRLAVLLEGTTVRARSGHADPAAGEMTRTMAVSLVTQGLEMVRDPSTMLD